MAARVLIIERDVEVGQLAAETLASAGYDVCGIAATGEAGLAVALREKPDAALVDMSFPGTAAVQLIAKITGELRRTRCIATLSTSTSPSAVRVIEALAAGARGFIEKPFRAADLVRQLEEVLVPTTTVSPVEARALLEELRGNPRDRRSRDKAGLSNSEMAMLKALVHGHRYADVAKALGVDDEPEQTYLPGFMINKGR